MRPRGERAKFRSGFFGDVVRCVTALARPRCRYNLRSVQGMETEDTDDLRSALATTEKALQDALRRAEIAERKAAEFEAEKSLADETAAKDTRLQVLEAREEIRARHEQQLTDQKAESNEQLRHYRSLLASRESELETLRQRLTEIDAADGDHVDHVRAEAEAEEPRPVTPEVTDPTHSEETPPTPVPVSPPLAPLPTHPLCNPFTLPSLSRFSGNKPDDEEAVDQFVREFTRHAQLSQWEGAVILNDYNSKSTSLGGHFACMSLYLARSGRILTQHSPNGYERCNLCSLSHTGEGYSTAEYSLTLRV